MVNAMVSSHRAEARLAVSLRVKATLPTPLDPDGTKLISARVATFFSPSFAPRASSTGWGTAARERLGRNRSACLTNAYRSQDLGQGETRGWADGASGVIVV
jgi:hypothetical protein